ncbi:MAG: M23 family metallopeptidase [Myxococcaceae bacterium]
MRLVLLVVSLSASLAFAGDPCATVTEEKVNGGFNLIAELKNCSDVTFTVTLTDAQNLAPETPLTLESPPKNNGRFVLVKFRAVDRNERWQHQGWHQDWRIGRRLGETPPPATYQQPFEGKRKVIQKPHGSFSHFNGSMHEEAWDWAMPEGTKVLAAREGVVTGFRKDSNVGCGDSSCQYENNYVILRHDDGTYGQYAHLRPGGVLVTLGQRVRVGEAIGESGNTGWSSEPHLHFEVFNAVDGKTQVTLPIEWAPAGKRQDAPKDGKRDAVNDAVDALEKSWDE